jgi:hypothetical protein
VRPTASDTDTWFGGGMLLALTTDFLLFFPLMMVKTYLIEKEKCSLALALFHNGLLQIC